MGDITQLAAFCLLATVMLAVVRENRPEIARQMSLVAGLIVFGVILWRVGYAVEVVQDLGFKIGFAQGHLGIVIRAVGIAYITEFAAAACRDAGESALAAKLELAGKVAILLVGMPVIVSVFDLVFRLLT